MKIRSVFVTASVLVATGAGVLSTTGTATAAPAAPAARSAAASTTYAATAVKATNRERKANSRHRLKKSSCLTRFAKAQATAMARSNTMYHQALSPIQAGCNVGWVGENVAYGFASGTKVVVDGWMKSPEHRANLLDKHYKRVGIAAVQAADGTWYVSQVFGKKA